MTTLTWRYTLRESHLQPAIESLAERFEGSDSTTLKELEDAIRESDRCQELIASCWNENETLTAGLVLGATLARSEITVSPWTEEDTLPIVRPPEPEPTEKGTAIQAEEAGGESTEEDAGGEDDEGDGEADGEPGELGHPPGEDTTPAGDGTEEEVAASLESQMPQHQQEEKSGD